MPNPVGLCRVRVFHRKKVIAELKTVDANALLHMIIHTPQKGDTVVIDEVEGDNGVAKLCHLEIDTHHYY